MNTRLLTVHDVQGEHIHRALGRAPRARVGRPITLEDYRKAHRLVLRPGFAQHTSKLPLVMGVNHGRWVGLCPECHTGICVDPAWPEARCFACGAVFEQVIWPRHQDTIERLLLKRPIRHQHWTPGEDVGILAVENITHGLEDLR